MPITGHPHNLLRRGRDYAADITSSSTIIKKSIKSLIRKTISSLSIHGPAGSGKATAVAQVLVAIDRDITNFTSVIWIESSSTTSSVGMLQHFLINQIVAQAPDLRKMTSNAEVTFAPPTTVQDGTILLSKMMSDAQLCGHSFLFILNECDNPFLPNELGLGFFDQSFCILTHSRIAHFFRLFRRSLPIKKKCPDIFLHLGSFLITKILNSLVFDNSTTYFMKLLKHKIWIHKD